MPEQSTVTLAVEKCTTDYFRWAPLTRRHGHRPGWYNVAQYSLLSAPVYSPVNPSATRKVKLPELRPVVLNKLSPCLR